MDWLRQLVETSQSVREVFGSISGSVKSDTLSSTSRHRYDVSSDTPTLNGGDGSRYLLRGSD